MGAFEFEAIGRASPKSPERRRPTNSRMRALLARRAERRQRRRSVFVHSRISTTRLGTWSLNSCRAYPRGGYTHAADDTYRNTKKRENRTTDRSPHPHRARESLARISSGNNRRSSVLFIAYVLPLAVVSRETKRSQSAFRLSRLLYVDTASRDERAQRSDLLKIDAHETVSLFLTIDDRFDLSRCVARKHSGKYIYIFNYSNILIQTATACKVRREKSMLEMRAE